MDDLIAYLRYRPWHQLRRLQRALNCRVEGDTRRRSALQASILAHARRDGLTLEHARCLAEGIKSAIAVGDDHACSR